MPFDINRAKKDGVSEDLILNYLSKSRPEFDVTAALNDGHSKNEIIEYLSSKEVSTNTKSVEDVKSVGGFAKNIISSTGNLLSGVGHSIAHPIETTKAISKLGAGGIDFASDLLFGKAPADQKPQYIQENRQAFDVTKDVYKDRYGGASNIKNTLYKDPVGALADISSVIGGAGSLASKTGEVANISKLSRAGSTLTKAAEAANPVSAAISVPKKISSVLPGLPSANKIKSVLTNTPQSVFEGAKDPFTAPYVKLFKESESNPALKANLGSEIYAKAKNIYAKAQNAYEQSRDNIISQYGEQIVSKQPEIQSSVIDFLKSKDAGGISLKKGKINLIGSAFEKNKVAQSTLQDLYDLAGSSFTPDEILNRRQAISNIISEIPVENANLRRVANGIIKIFDNSIDNATVDSAGNSLTEALRADYAKKAGPAKKIIKSLIKRDNGVPSFSEDKAISFVNGLISESKFDNSGLLESFDKVAKTDFSRQAKAIGIAKAISRFDPPTAGRVSDVLKSFVIAKIPGVSAFVSPAFWGNVALRQGLKGAKAAQFGESTAQKMLNILGEELIKAPSVITPTQRLSAPVTNGINLSPSPSY